MPHDYKRVLRELAEEEARVGARMALARGSGWPPTRCGRWTRSARTGA